jgi:hypothetical protein
VASGSVRLAVPFPPMAVEYAWGSDLIFASGGFLNSQFHHYEAMQMRGLTFPPSCAGWPGLGLALAGYPETCCLLLDTKVQNSGPRGSWSQSGNSVTAPPPA